MLAASRTRRLTLALPPYRAAFLGRCSLRSSAALKPRDEPDPAFVRPLGSVEEMFAAYGEIGGSSFSLAARIRGELNRDRLEASIHALQSSNEYLSLTICKNANGRRYFARTGERIPLRIVDLAATSWEAAMENELAMPFANDGTLVRVTALLGREGEHILVPTFHHSLADGLSGLAILKDLLLATSGYRPAMSGHATADTLEDTFGAAFQPALATMASTPPPPFPPPRNTWAYKRNRNPTIQGRALSPESTQRLVSRARSEGTTVSAALVAALSRTRYHRRGQATYPVPDGLRVLVPFDTKPYALPPTSMLGVFIGAVVLAVPPPPRLRLQVQVPTPDDFWAQARGLGHKIHGGKGRDEALGLACAAALQMERDASAEGVMGFMRTATDHEALLTNVGVVDRHVPGVCGGFEVKEVWPIALKTCIEGEDNVGVGTFGGRLRLVHSSLDGTEGLLDGMVQILEESCE